MASMAAPLRHWPKAAAAASSRRHFFTAVEKLEPFTSSPSPNFPKIHRISSSHGFGSCSSFADFNFPKRVSSKLHGIAPYADSAFLEEETEDNDRQKKSRNQKKREARRSVKWGMDLAKFSPSQIRRILKMASVEDEVFEEIMLVKRLGPDVREGRRRQFSYIAKLLRNAQPELMDELIRATKDGDISRIQFDDTEDEEEIENDDDVDEDALLTSEKWLEGLISKDPDVINQVYSINSVDFDRQELRRLVRGVQVIQIRESRKEEEEEEDDDDDEEQEERSEDDELTKARAALSRFLRRLALQCVIEQSPFN